MSDVCRCEGCGKQGYRRRGYLAPAEWLYIESKIEDEDDSLIIWVCSQACANGLWRSGPGPRMDLTEGGFYSNDRGDLV